MVIKCAECGTESPLNIECEYCHKTFCEKHMPEHKAWEHRHKLQRVLGRRSLRTRLVQTMGQDPRRLQSSILQMVSRRTTQCVIPLPRQTHPHMEKEQARDHMGGRTDRERSTHTDS